jgi:tetratricopeptide (TPR) repeat protein
MISRSVGGYLLCDMTDWTRAKKQSMRSLELARRIGARRFEPEALFDLARVKAVEGDRAEAAKLANEAYEIARDTGITFSGPWALGALAAVTDDPDQRKWALAKGEEILRQICVSHNYFHFYRDAIEVSIEHGNWDEADRYAAALEDYTRPEPLPWTDYFIAWGRALAAHGRGDGDRASLLTLRDEAARVGLHAALPALLSALCED